MSREYVEVRLSHDQALVLSDWLDRVVGTAPFDHIVNPDRAVWSPLHTLAGTLETTLPTIFSADYGRQLAEAANDS